MREEIIDHTLGQEMDLEIDGQEGCTHSFVPAMCVVYYQWPSRESRYYCILCSYANLHYHSHYI